MSKQGALEDLSVISPWLPAHGPHCYSWASTSGGSTHFYIIQQKGTLEYAPSNLYLNVKCPLKPSCSKGSPPGSLLKMQNHRLHPRPPESESALEDGGVLGVLCED